MKNLSSTILFTVLFFQSMISLAAEAPTPVSQKALLEMIESGQEMLILDVRSKAEFEQGHVPGAKNIPFKSVPAQLANLEQYKGKPIVVYCEVGGRAAFAEGSLMRAGFKDIRHLTGDFGAWRKNKLPTEKPSSGEGNND